MKKKAEKKIDQKYSQEGIICLSLSGKGWVVAQRQRALSLHKALDLFLSIRMKIHSCSCFCDGDIWTYSRLLQLMMVTRRLAYFKLMIESFLRQGEGIGRMKSFNVALGC